MAVCHCMSALVLTHTCAFNSSPSRVVMAALAQLNQRVDAGSLGRCAGRYRANHSTRRFPGFARWRRVIAWARSCEFSGELCWPLSSERLNASSSCLCLVPRAWCQLHSLDSVITSSLGLSSMMQCGYSCSVSVCYSLGAFMCIILCVMLTAMA